MDQGRRKLVQVSGDPEKIYIQDEYFSVNVYIDLLTIPRLRNYGRLHLWQGMLHWIVNLFIKRLNTVIKCCGFFNF